MPITRASVTITFLANKSAKDLQSEIQKYGLEYVSRGVESGEWPSRLCADRIQEIPPEHVSTELAYLGCDADFFDKTVAEPSPAGGLESPESFLCSDELILTEALRRLEMEEVDIDVDRYSLPEEVLRYVKQLYPSAGMLSYHPVRLSFGSGSYVPHNGGVSLWGVKGGHLAVVPDLRRHPCLKELLGPNLRWLRIHYALIWLERLRVLMQIWPGCELLIQRTLSPQEDSIECWVTNGSSEELLAICIPIANRPAGLSVRNSAMWDPFRAHFRDLFFSQMDDTSV